MLKEAGSVIDVEEEEEALPVSYACLFIYFLRNDAILISLPSDHQEPVSLTIKLRLDFFVGIVGSLLESYDHAATLVIDDFWRDIVGVMVVVYLFYLHYPVNGCLISFYIVFIFLTFWYVLKAHGVLVADVDSFLQFHLFVVLFYLAKLILDVVGTLFRLV